MVATGVTDPSRTMNTTINIRSSVIALLGILLFTNFSDAQQSLRFAFPEQHDIQVRSPETLRSANLPDLVLPTTVSDSHRLDEQRISLDEAIHIAVQNAEIIRVLTGCVRVGRVDVPSMMLRFRMLPLTSKMLSLIPP